MLLSPRFNPVSWQFVRLKEGFWGRKQKINRQRTLRHQYEFCGDRIDAFQLNWTEKSGRAKPHMFWDSDLAKWMEAASYSLATHPDVILKERLDSVIDLMAKAQMPDGYLNSYFQQFRPEDRWANLHENHELYCAGHLIEAAVVNRLATGDEKFLQVILKYVDHIAERFGSGPNQVHGYPGHPEIELALMRLWRLTGDDKHSRLAKYFIDQRGQSPNIFLQESERFGPLPYGLVHYQAHLPVRDQKVAEGHAVRMAYLLCGMVDVATASGDQTLLQSCYRLWKNIIEKRMYVTGGIGSTSVGESFTLDYDLPNEQAYAETCASIGMVQLAHRLLQIDGDSQYADVMEHLLYNAVASGVSLSGDRFFYDNYLASEPGWHHLNHRKPDRRQKSYGCYCCPPNIARLLAGFGQYIYSRCDQAIVVHLYAQGHVDVEVEGQPVRLVQLTDYPWKETVRFRIESDAPIGLTLALRQPGWSGSFDIQVNGKSTSYRTKNGYAWIHRTWQRSDELLLTLSMPPRRMVSHPHVRQNQGHVALARGPMVYCLEEVDNGPHLQTLFLPDDSPISSRYESRLLGGVVTLNAVADEEVVTSDWKHILYRSLANLPRRSRRIKAVPYYAWANRRQGQMRVWIPRS